MQHKNGLEFEKEQFVDFIYNQLIDGFVYLTTDKPIDWDLFPSIEKKIKKLANSFVIRDLNEALIQHFGSNREKIMGITLKSYFGKYFNDNSAAWKKLISESTVFSEFRVQRRDGADLWIEANFKLVTNTENKTVAILLQAGLPEATQIAHKHAYATESDGLIHTMGDSGIIYTPGGNYILSIFLHDPIQMVFDPANRMIAELSEAVYNYFNIPQQ